MRCRVCKCTYERACDNGCGWAEPELCTNCAKMAEWLRDYAEVAYKLNWAGLRREMERPARPARDRGAR